ncbi:MAG TPA: helix-turn-helix transcriptional regulator [Reyranella sp.]|nr:helix-turn-helix transcriptional regulator [Reyranella sp.]HTE82410.1 helix-turn-helix transcriptional regulator [Reyranella sp.]
MTPIAKWMKSNAPEPTRKGDDYQWLAEKLGVSYNSARRYIVGERLPSPDVMRKIAKLTGGAITANEFFGIKRDAVKRAA